MHIKTTVFAAALALTANTAFAGGLSPAITETPLMEKAMVAPAGPSIDPTYIVVGVLTALLLAATVGSEDDNGGNGSEGDDGGRETGVLECPPYCPIYETPPVNLP